MIAPALHLAIDSPGTDDSPGLPGWDSDRADIAAGGEAHMNGWLMWGLILPLLLVVAGTIVLLRRRNGPR